jgi:precorrin-6B methylase 1
MPDAARGALVVCPTPIGNLGDVTLRVLDELRRASVAACEDTRRSRTLLDRHHVTVPLVALHEHNERAQTPALLARIEAGERVCLLSDAGMPALSDPGALLVREALDRGLPVEVLPGASSVTTAATTRGCSWTSPSTAGTGSRSIALRQVLEEKLVRRSVSLKGLDYGKVEEATQGTVRQVATLTVGISSDKAREINKMIKEKGPKGISSQTQGDQVRVTSKKRDDLQAVIALLKGADLGVPLQFSNFRD